MPDTVTHDLSGQTILVVEDEYFLAFDVADALRRCGADIAGPAPDLQSAEALIASGRPTLALLDMNLRGSSGEEIADRLELEGIPFAILTGYDRSALPARLQSRPYLEKPATAHALTALIVGMIADAERD